MDPNVYLALPVKRIITFRDDSWYPAQYLANNPAPGGLFESPTTINGIPDGDVDRHAAQLYAGYGQEDVIRELLSGETTPSQAFMHVVPNPAGTWVKLSLSQPGPSSRIRYALTNTMGAYVMGGEFQGSEHRMDVSAIPRGLYLLTAHDGSQRFTTPVTIQ